MLDFKPKPGAIVYGVNLERGIYKGIIYSVKILQEAERGYKPRCIPTEAMLDNLEVVFAFKDKEEQKRKYGLFHHIFRTEEEAFRFFESELLRQLNNAKVVMSSTEEAYHNFKTRER